MARATELNRNRAPAIRGTGPRGRPPIMLAIAVLVAVVATGLSVTLSPETTAAVLVAALLGSTAVWVILRHPYRALEVSLFVVLVAWTKFRVRDPLATLRGDIDWQIAVELVLYALLGILVLRVWWLSGIAQHRSYWIDLVALLYIALILASILWSPTPRISTVRSFQLVVQFGLVLTIVRLAGRTGLMRNLAATIFAYVLIFGGIALVVPGARGSHVDEYGFGRVYWFSMSPGTVAALAAVAGLFALSAILFELRLRRESRFGISSSTWMAVWLLLLLVLLLSTRARGMTIAFVAASSILLLLRFAKSWAIAIGASVALLVPAVFLSLAMSPDDLLVAGSASGNPMLEFLYRGQSAPELLTMSSRTSLWEITASLVKQHPLIGHGYLSSRAVLIREVPWAGYAHNALFQVVLDLGIVGTALLAVLILSPYRIIRELPFSGKGPVAPAILAITTFLLVNSIVGESFAGAAGLDTILLLCLALGAARPPSPQVTSR